MKFQKGTVKDSGFRILGFFSAMFIILTTIVFVIVLVKNSELAIKTFGVWHFITSRSWNPPLRQFGGAPAIFGSIVSTVIAMILSMPVAIGTAIFLTEISPKFLKGPIGTAIELLAAIPSIIYGMWGLFVFAPIIRDDVQPIIHVTLGKIPVVGSWFSGYTPGIGLLTASIILAIMILPFTAAIARDSFDMVPNILKESAYGLGATKWDVIKDVVIPYARSGVIGGMLLSFGRAIGETMAVTFVMGNQPVIPSSILSPATSITVTLANEFTEADSNLYLSSLFYLALILFTLSFVAIAAGKFLFLRKRT